MSLACEKAGAFPRKPHSKTHRKRTRIEGKRTLKRTRREKTHPSHLPTARSESKNRVRFPAKHPVLGAFSVRFQGPFLGKRTHLYLW